MKSWRWRDLAVFLLLAAAVVAVFAGAAIVLRHERAGLLADLERERRQQLADAARRFGDELDDIAEDVRFASDLARRAQRTSDIERELAAMLEVVGQYRAAALYGPDGAHRVTIYDRHATAELRRPPFPAALADAARRAAERPGRLVTSPPVARSETGEYRVFAHAPAGAGAVSVLVDMGPLFGPFQVLTASEQTRLLLLGAHQRPTVPSDPAITALVSSDPPPGLRRVLDRMALGEAGCERTPPGEAERMQLGDADVLACFEAIPVRDGEHWSAATFSSTRALAASDQRLLARLLAATAAVLALLGLLGGYGVVAARRAVQLRESRRLAERLAQLHERTRRMLDQLPTGVAALDEAGGVSFVNRLLRERTGEVPDGATLEVLFAQAHPDAVARVRALVDRANTTGEAVAAYGERIQLFGDAGDYNLHVIPAGGADPATRCLVVLEDISQVRSLEAQLIRAEKLATTGVLAAGIAHEIGTPLGVVRGRAEYLLGKLGASHPQAGGLQVIQDQIDRVSRTLRQLLDFARLQAPAVRPVDVAAVLTAVRELVAVEADRRELSFEVRCEPGLRVAADADQLQQVLVNLVLNAFDACRPGGVVSVSAAPSGGAVLLAVKDDGVGIPVEHQARVFDPFFTTKKRGQGTGLGLTVVEQLVRNHGGQVHLSSDEGGGTEVRLTWPAAGAGESLEVGRAAF